MAQTFVLTDVETRQSPCAGNPTLATVPNYFNMVETYVTVTGVEACPEANPTSIIAFSLSITS